MGEEHLPCLYIVHGLSGIALRPPQIFNAQFMAPFRNIIKQLTLPDRLTQGKNCGKWSTEFLVNRVIMSDKVKLQWFT